LAFGNSDGASYTADFFFFMYLITNTITIIKVKIGKTIPATTGAGFVNDYYALYTGGVV
jgi:hypothetical protein